MYFAVIISSVMELFETIKKRRSVRDFDSNKQVSKSDIEKIVLSGEQAPVAKAQYRDILFTVVQNANIIKKIVGIAKNPNRPHLTNAFYNAPTIIIIAQRKLETFLTLGHQNTGAIIENMLLAATALNIESIYVYSGIQAVKDNGELLSELNIPADFTITASIGLGYNLNDNKQKFSRKINVNWV
jgi:nitroreductase